MKDEQCAARAREHLEKADQLIEKLIAAGAGQLEGLREPLTDAIEMLDELEFEEGDVVGSGEREQEEEEDEPGNELEDEM